MAKNLLATLVCAALAACGGGGTDSTAAPLSTCNPAPIVRVQLFGDSTMAGYEGGTSPSALALHTPTVVLQAALDARFGRGAALVVNRGVGGTTAKELVAGTDGLNQRWPQSVAAEIVVVNHGINDLTHDADIAAYRTALRVIAQNTGGARLVFETPNMVQVYNTAPYAQAMREVAAEFKVPVADTNALPAAQQMLGDWAHPTDAGYISIVANSLAPAVVPLVAALLCR